MCELVSSSRLRNPFPVLFVTVSMAKTRYSGRFPARKQSFQYNQFRGKHFKWLSRAASSNIDRKDILRAGVSVIRARKLRTKSRLFPCIRSGSKKGLSLARSPKVRTIYWDTSFAIFANILHNVRSLTQGTNAYNAVDLCFSLQKQTTASIIKKYARITPLKWKPTWVFLFHPCMDFRPCAQSVARGDWYIRKANNFITPCVIFPSRPLFLSLSLLKVTGSESQREPINHRGRSRCYDLFLCMWPKHGEIYIPQRVCTLLRTIERMEETLRDSLKCKLNECLWTRNAKKK